MPRKMIRRLALLAALSSVVASSSASAAPLADDYATGPFLAAAQSYWARMLPGRTPPCPTTIAFVDESFMASRGWNPDDSAMGDVRGCRIWIKRTFWNAYDADAPSDVQALCNTVVHEYGHNLGLGHTPNYPVMVNAALPAECGGPADNGNPHLARTEALYRSKRTMRNKLRRCRAHHQHVSRRPCRPAKLKLVSILDKLADLEGA